MFEHKGRYAGTRWRVVCGAYGGVEQFALDELQRAVQTFHPYVVPVYAAASAGNPKNHPDHLIVVGTAKDNPLIADLAARKLVRVPPKPDAFALACLKSPWNARRKVLAVAGRDARGVLYGVEDLNARVLSRYWPHEGAPRVMPEIPSKRRESFDAMPEFAVSEAPRIESRGLWTWGYVIYDYRRFFDNMARLKMNTLIVWNDVPPVNAAQVIDYAHARGVRIIAGFHWGWGLDNLDLSSASHARMIRKQVVEAYRRDYLPLDIDGIYFQTQTEHKETTKGSRTLAAVVTDWVNRIAEGLYEITPDLYIQFGLHATSIRENYADLAKLDPRISIVWEDAGALPYAYNPHELSYGPETGLPGPWSSVEATLEYSKKLATFRPGSEFAMVPKGWMALRWTDEFEHHGPFILGERDPAWIRRRLEERRPRWDYVNATWLKNFPLALRFYREVLACKPARMLAAALVEDGMFEEEIQPSVSLFAQSVWDPTRGADDVLELAMSPYYRGT